MLSFSIILPYLIVDLKLCNRTLEGINGIIKKIKNTAYGYTNWNNFINRIFLERVWFRAKSSKAAA
ncbi:transposase [Klebsiella pneumoniae]|nr:transposase [Klebsiella pneumoniae]MDP0947100.1 transposase [Klebsiella pneumoniae]